MGKASYYEEVLENIWFSDAWIRVGWRVLPLQAINPACTLLNSMDDSAIIKSDKWVGVGWLRWGIFWILIVYLLYPRFFSAITVIVRGHRFCGMFWLIFGSYVMHLPRILGFVGAGD